MLVLILGSIGYLQWTFHWRGGTYFQWNWGRNWTMIEMLIGIWGELVVEMFYIVYVKELVLVEVHVISFFVFSFLNNFWAWCLGLPVEVIYFGGIILNNRFCGVWIDMKTSGHFNFSHILYLLCSRINKSSTLWTNSNFYEKE